MDVLGTKDQYTNRFLCSGAHNVLSEGSCDCGGPQGLAVSPP